MENLQQHHLQELFNKPQWEQAEYQRFLELLETLPPEQLQSFFLENYIAHLPQVSPADTTHAGQLLQQIHERLGMTHEQPPVVSIRKKSILRRWVVAASIIAAVGMVSYLLFFSNTKKPAETITVAETKGTDVEAPQSVKAVIKLADGRTVAIDSLTTLTQSNVSLTKTADGKIIYTGSANEIAYNTLSNPKGSKVIDIQLADGSHVWLNAGSSVTYPVAFAGNERKVSITGEAYFEITHNAAMPFKVNKGETEITVLGTHFNVNAYDDESDIKITLLEGSVKVRNRNSEGLLKPGEQAQVATDIKIVSKVDTDQVMAWKNGLFVFDGYGDIQTIMRQLARWYNVEVEYRGKVTTTFWGSVSRSENVSQVLRMLEATGGVSFKVEDRKVTVIPVK